MKILAVYYSYSGNTDNVIKIWLKVLSSSGEVTVQRLKPKQEIEGFGAQCRAAFTGKRAELAEDIIYDASPYDLIILGSPVWAFAPVPAMNAYLDKINGLHGKKAVVLLTSGSGLGVNKCFNSIKRVLKNKGVSHIDEINIPDRKQRDTDFISSAISKYL